MTSPVVPTGGVGVTAPVRIADVGGWTDTWFARSGAVCHLAVGPGVHVHARLAGGDHSDLPVHLVAPDIGADYHFGPSTRGWHAPTPLRQPLLEHAVAAVLESHPPPSDIEVLITSSVPPGASLGTSASVLVALITALEQLLQPSQDHRLTSSDRNRLAAAAHAVETTRVGREAGVQDHWAAAFGGAELLRIDPYPHVEVTPIPLDRATTEALGRVVVTVAFGAHDSSVVHAEVIDLLGRAGASGHRMRTLLGELAVLAGEAAAALRGGDLEEWAQILTRSTEIQAALHPGLIGRDHRSAIDDAQRHGALGWKVNGAGGNGGSLSVVFAAPVNATSFARFVQTKREHWRLCALQPAPGITIEWDHPQ